MPVPGADGTVAGNAPVPDEVLERIASDVRAFDKSLTPEVQTLTATQKLAELANRAEDRYEHDEPQRQETAEANVSAQEIQALALVLALPTPLRATVIEDSVDVQLLFSRYGLNRFIPDVPR